MNKSEQKVLSAFRAAGKTALNVGYIDNAAGISELDRNAGLAHLREEGYVKPTSMGSVRLTSMRMRSVADYKPAFERDISCSNIEEANVPSWHIPAP
jgi:hypothetical protein